MEELRRVGCPDDTSQLTHFGRESPCPAVCRDLCIVDVTLVSDQRDGWLNLKSCWEMPGGYSELADLTNITAEGDYRQGILLSSQGFGMFRLELGLRLVTVFTVRTTASCDEFHGQFEKGNDVRRVRSCGLLSEYGYANQGTSAFNQVLHGADLMLKIEA